MARRVFWVFGGMVAWLSACGPVDGPRDGGAEGGLDGSHTSDASDATVDRVETDLGTTDLALGDTSIDQDADVDARSDDASMDDTGVDSAVVDAETDGGLDSGMALACPPPGVCNVITNAGCSGGTVCVLGLSAPMCGAGGTGGDNDPCDPLGADCREGYFCTPISRVCRRFCCPEDPTGCPTGQQCITRLEGTGVSICTPSARCSPVEQTGCSIAGLACYFYRDDGTTVCAQEGMGTIGSACMSVNGCRSGLACVNARVGCRRLCDPLNATHGCTPTEGVCTPVHTGSGSVLCHVCVPTSDGGAG